MKLTDNSPQVLAAIDAAIESGLTIIGGKAEGYAKALAPKDTGLLQNSITYALGGQPPAISAYNAATGGGSGSYAGTAPADEGNQRSVYIGTNVEYAPYQEYGTSSMKHPNSFLRPGIEPHMDEFKAVLESELQKAVGNLK